MTTQYTKMGGSWRRHKMKKRRPNLFKKMDKKTLIKNAALLGVALFVLGTIFTLGIFAWATKDLPDPGELISRDVVQSTKIFDRTGEQLLYEIHGQENRTLVELKQIPEDLVNATIALEDQQFYTHAGFNPVRIFKGVILGTLLKGRAQGGSTITQQLVKNAILTDERTISRKIKELILSIEIERRFEKEDILQLYFNEIPYGSTNYGVESAAQAYFGKSITEISLAECATLASLPKAPSRYLNNPDLLDDRRDLTLQLMVNEGYLEQSVADAAMEETVELQANIANINAPHFVLWVKETLEETYGERMVEQGGLRVTTSLDWDKQQAAEEAVTNHVDETGERYGFTNASLVAIDPNNGHILAMVGSKDYFDDEIDGQVNVALRDRQPGSSFKPIVYTAGFTEGYTPSTVLWDVKTNFPSTTGTYSPNNYDLSERGPVTVRTALQGSLNIPAVKMSYLVGVEDALDFAESLGYTTFADRSRFGLSLVLGGAEVKLLDHVNAYAVFANEGTYYEPVSILKVEDADGQVLEEWKETKGKNVLDANHARTITDVLSDNNARAYVFGTGSSLQLGARPVAAKTGTTNDYRDGWTIGYTPSLVAGVWGGNNDNSEMARGAGGSTVAAPIWNAFMSAALAEEPIEYFTEPVLEPTGKAMLDGGLAATTVEVDKTSGKLATEYTPESQKETVTFAEYHSILYYVYKDDPLGGIPGAESTDYQFESWEAAVATWLANKQEETGITIEQGEPPTEYDDVHVPANFPEIQITSPSSGESLTSRQVTLRSSASAPRGVARIEYYLDDFYLAVSNGTASVNANIPNTIDRGTHKLRAVAYDDVDNSAIAEINIKIDSDPADTNFKIMTPQNGQTIEAVNEGFSVVVELQDPSKYDSVLLFVRPQGSGSLATAGTVENPSSPFVSFDWTLPEPGDYVLSARAYGSGSNPNLETPGIIVHVTEGAEAPAEEPEEGEEGEEPTEEEEEALPNLDPFAQD